MTATPDIASATELDDSALKRARILIVDDQQSNILVMESLLGASDFTNLTSTTDPSEVVTLCAETDPDLIILDLHMPEIDGFEVMGMLRPWTRGSSRLPILVVTADVSPEVKRRALSLGARDFLTKPVDPTEVLLRVTNLVESRLIQNELREQNRALEQRVREGARELEEARLEVIERLAFAAEYRDDETGEHTARVGRTSARLARQVGLAPDIVELIRRAAPLHDVGKLGVSDAILLKPGELGPEEFELMKLHVAIGGEILAESRSRLLQMSEEIALTHHERWDGSGYPAGLRGESIPITGRLVALADSFDALTHRRPYKEAQPIAEAVAEIRRLSGVHFDPRVVEAFEALDHEALLAPIEDGAPHQP